MTLPRYETTAGASFAATLRLEYMSDKVQRLPNRASYANLVVFFRPGPISERWNAQPGNWVRDRPIDISAVTVAPARQKVESDNQEMTFQVTIPGTFAMTALLPRADDDRIELAMAAAYVADGEQILGNGPPGRTWDIARVVVRRRPSVAVLTGTDGRDARADEHYFANAKSVLGRWMHVEESPQVRNLREAIAWIREAAPTGIPWGMIHLVGHSDGNVWLLKRWPIEEIPAIPTRTGWYELPPWAIESVASELRRTNRQPQAEHVARDSHVVFHICQFAVNGDGLLRAAQSLFAAAPTVHGTPLFVAFGAVDSGAQPSVPVESLARLPSGPNGPYQTVEVSPDPLLSTRFMHIAGS